MTTQKGLTPPTNHTSTARFTKLGVITAVLFTAIGLLNPMTAFAVGGDDLFWVSHNTIQIASDDGTGTPATIVASSPQPSDRFLAADTSHLYFFDGQTYTSRNLVRTNLDGTGRVLLQAGVNNPSSIAINDDYIIYALWNGGVYGISKSSPTDTPVLLSNQASIQGLTISGSDVFYAVNGGALYHGELNGLALTTFTANTDSSGFAALGVSSLYAYGEFLYAAGGGGLGKIYKIQTQYWNDFVSQRGYLDVSSVAPNPWGVTALDSYVYFTDGNGRVGRISNGGGSPTTLVTQGTSSHGIAVVPGAYTVSYANGGGTGTAMSPQTSRSPIDLSPLTYSRAGYDFAGWKASTDNEIYANLATYTFGVNVTMTAQWLGELHAVSYSTQGGSSITDGSFRTGETLTLPAAPTRSGYTFNGWFTSASGGTALSSPYTPGVMTDIGLFAQWTANTNVVTYDSDGGSSVSNASFTTGGTLTLPAAPTRSGYTFNGWFTSPTGGTALSSPYSPSGTSAITLHAQWTSDSPASPTALPNTGSYAQRLLNTSGALVLGGVILLSAAFLKRRKS